MRDHNPVAIEFFNGLWAREPKDACPQDHFTDCNNVVMMQKGFKTRPGLDTYLPFPNIKRVYTFVKSTGERIICLDIHGNLYDTASATPNVPILTIATMTDFALLSINDRAYISPHDGAQGLSGEFIYVYLGDGNAARKIGGDIPVNGGTPFAGAASATAGNVEKGDHIYGIIYETNTGFLTSIGPTTGGVRALVKVTSDGTKKVDLSHIPAPSDTTVYPFYWVVATKAIQNYNGDQIGYNFYFVAGSRTATSGMSGNQTVNFYDADLLDDASHLLDIKDHPAAVVGMCTFHNRLITWAENGATSVIRASFANEPESFDTVDGLIAAPLDAHPVTNAQEFRDVLYVFKDTKTLGFPDNGDVPSTWVPGKVDLGIGTFVHGISTILDTAGANVDFLVVLTYGGIYLFNGTYLKPELSWKIRDFWTNFTATNFKSFQVCTDSISQIIYVNMLSSILLMGDYSQGSDPYKIRWTKQTFNIQTDTIAIIDKNKLIIGSSQQVAP